METKNEIQRYGEDEQGCYCVCVCGEKARYTYASEDSWFCECSKCGELLDED
jgi:hypothetical protein